MPPRDAARFFQKNTGLIWQLIHRGVPLIELKPVGLTRRGLVHLVKLGKALETYEQAHIHPPGTMPLIQGAKILEDQNTNRLRDWHENGCPPWAGEWAGKIPDIIKTTIPWLVYTEQINEINAARIVVPKGSKTRQELVKKLDISPKALDDAVAAIGGWHVRQSEASRRPVKFLPEDKWKKLRKEDPVPDDHFIARPKGKGRPFRKFRWITWLIFNDARNNPHPALDNSPLVRAGTLERFFSSSRLGKRHKRSREFDLWAGKDLRKLNEWAENQHKASEEFTEDGKKKLTLRRAQKLHPKRNVSGLVQSGKLVTEEEKKRMRSAVVGAPRHHRQRIVTEENLHKALTASRRPRPPTGPKNPRRFKSVWAAFWAMLPSEPRGPRREIFASKESPAYEAIGLMLADDEWEQLLDLVNKREKAKRRPAFRHVSRLKEYVVHCAKHKRREVAHSSVTVNEVVANGQGSGRPSREQSRQFVEASWHGEHTFQVGEEPPFPVSRRDALVLGAAISFGGRRVMGWELEKKSGVDQADRVLRRLKKRKRSPSPLAPFIDLPGTKATPGYLVKITDKRTAKAAAE